MSGIGVMVDENSASHHRNYILKYIKIENIFYCNNMFTILLFFSGFWIK